MHQCMMSQRNLARSWRTPGCLQADQHLDQSVVGLVSSTLHGVNMHCTICIVFYAMYSMHCILFNVFYALYSIYLEGHASIHHEPEKAGKIMVWICIVLYALYSTHCILCIVFYSLYSMLCIEVLCIALFASFSFNWILCIITLKLVTGRPTGHLTN